MRTAQTIEAQSLQDVKPVETRKKRTQTNPRSLANLKPFKPGQCGNPEGKNGRDVAQEIAKAIFSQNPEVIYQAYGKALSGGNAYAFQVLADRAYGKLKETKEVTHKYQDVSDGDLQQEIDRILGRLGLARDADRAAEIGRAAIGASETECTPQAADVLPR